MYKNGWGLHLKGCPKVFDWIFDDEIKGKPKLGFNMYFNLKNNE